jgi:hypothetical protein
MIVREILQAYLTENGYDGLEHELFGEDGVCRCETLGICAVPFDDCIPYKIQDLPVIKEEISLEKGEANEP